MTTFSLATVLACLVLLAPAPNIEHGPGHDHGEPDMPAAPGQRMSFDESIGASADSPIIVGLEGAAADKRERDQDIPRQSENPQIQLMPGGRLNAGANDGFELQTTITQGWNLEGYGKARRAAAAAETEVLDAEARARALERRFHAAQAWIRLHGAERRLDLARADLELAEALVEALDQAREAGVVSRVDVAKARVLAAEVEGVVVELAGDVHDLGLALARETGTVTTTPLQTLGDYPNPPLPDEAELRRQFANVDQLPAVQLRRVRARAAVAEARSSERSRGAVLSTGASAQLESTGELVLFGIVGTNIPVIDRNQRERATAHAEAREADAEADQLVVDLSATLAIAVHELRHTGERVELLRDQTLPALDELVAARTLALELGEGTRTQLLEAQHQRSEVARELAAVEAEWVLARVQVWLYLQALEPSGSEAQ